MSDTAIVILIWTWLIWSVLVFFAGYFVGGYHALTEQFSRKSGQDVEP
jgi:hypothetical protein